MEEVLRAKVGRWFGGKAKPAADGGTKDTAEIPKERPAVEPAGDPVYELSGGRNLLEVEPGTYIIKRIDTADEDMNSFLFRLGCYSGEQITVISKKKSSCVVAIKDGRYNLDEQLSHAIFV